RPLGRRPPVRGGLTTGQHPACPCTPASRAKAFGDPEFVPEPTGPAPEKRPSEVRAMRLRSLARHNPRSEDLWLCVTGSNSNNLPPGSLHTCPVDDAPRDMELDGQRPLRPSHRVHQLHTEPLLLGQHGLAATDVPRRLRV